MSDISLEDMIAADLSAQMRMSMDKELSWTLMSEGLVEDGWTSVRVIYETGHREWTEVKQWAEDNCTSEHREHGGEWIFENPADATWFKMRWA